MILKSVVIKCSHRIFRGFCLLNRFPLSLSVPPTVTPFTFPSHVPIGTKIKVMCSSLEESSLSWSKDGETIRSGTDPAVALNKIEDVLLLFINGVQLKHVGNYTCTARNRFGASRFTAFLSVASPPAWRTRPNDINARKTGIDVLCEADGYPQPQVVWLKDGGSSLHTVHLKTCGTTLSS